MAEQATSSSKFSAKRSAGDSLVDIFADSDSDESNFEGFTPEDLETNVDYHSGSDTDDEAVDDLSFAYQTDWLKYSDEVPGPGFTYDGTETELEIFSKLLDDNFIHTCVVETNRYATQYFAKNPKETLKPNAMARLWFDVTLDEMRAFMGAIKLPTNDSYWSTSPLIEMAGFRKVMSRDRWQIINMFLHVADNDLANVPRDHPDYDRISKIRPAIEHIVENFQASYVLSRDVAVDESIIAFKGRVGMLQYMPQKPLCESVTGYCYNWCMYTGKKESTETGLTHGVVKKLCEPLLNLGHHVYMDNIFSSPELFTDLQDNQTGACGTLRTNRRGIPEEIKNVKLKKTDPAKFERDVVCRVDG